MDHTVVLNVSMPNESIAHPTKTNLDVFVHEPPLPDEITIKEEPLDELICGQSEANIRPLEFFDLGLSQIKLENFEAVPVQRRIVHDPLDPDDFEIKIENQEDENFVQRRIVLDPLAPDDFEIKIENQEDENCERSLNSGSNNQIENGYEEALSPDFLGFDIDESSLERLPEDLTCLSDVEYTQGNCVEVDQLDSGTSISNSVMVRDSQECAAQIKDSTNRDNCSTENLNDSTYSIDDNVEPCVLNNDSAINKLSSPQIDSQKKSGVPPTTEDGNASEIMIGFDNLENPNDQNDKSNCSTRRKQFSSSTDHTQAVRKLKVCLDFHVNVKTSKTSRKSRNSLLSALDSETEPNNFKEILEKLLVPENHFSKAHDEEGRKTFNSNETSSLKPSINSIKQRRYKFKNNKSVILETGKKRCDNATCQENEIKVAELSGKMIPIKKCFVQLERLQMLDKDRDNQKENPKKSSCIDNISNKESKLISLQLYKGIPCSNNLNNTVSLSNSNKRKEHFSHFDQAKKKNIFLDSSDCFTLQKSQMSPPISKSSPKKAVNDAVLDSSSELITDVESMSNISSILSKKKKSTREIKAKTNSCKRRRKRKLNEKTANQLVGKIAELETVLEADSSYPQDCSILTDNCKNVDEDCHSKEEECFDLKNSLTNGNDSIGSFSSNKKPVVIVNMEDDGKYLVTKNKALMKQLKIKINDWLISEGAKIQKVDHLKGMFPSILKEVNIPSSSAFQNKCYNCLFCDYLTYKKAFFYKHLWNHIAWFKCQMCEFKNQYRYKVERHLVDKHFPLLNIGKKGIKGKRFVCDICGMRFHDRHRLVRHKNSHNDEKMKYVCRICGYRAQRMRNPDSGALLLGKQDMINHMNKVHQEKLYKCKICGYSTNEQFVLIQHNKNVHQKIRPFSCDKCSFTSSNKGSLNMHVTLVHDKIKAFTCPICNMKLGLKHTLDKHLEHVHYKNNLLHCQFCPYSTPRKKDLFVHNYNKHMEKEKIYTCHYCSFSASTKRGVKNHIRRKHDVKKPYFCVYCKFKTSAKENLKEHIARHVKHHPYKCSLCTYSSKLKCHLKQHMQVHDKIKPFTCFHCSQRYSRKYYLRRHIEIKHNNKICLSDTVSQSETSLSQNINHSVSEKCPDQSKNAQEKDTSQLFETLVNGKVNKDNLSDLACQSEKPQSQNVNNSAIDKRPDQLKAFEQDFPPVVENCANSKENKNSLSDSACQSEEPQSQNVNSSATDKGPDQLKALEQDFPPLVENCGNKENNNNLSDLACQSEEPQSQNVNSSAIDKHPDQLKAFEQDFSPLVENCANDKENKNSLSDLACQSEEPQSQNVNSPVHLQTP